MSNENNNPGNLEDAQWKAYVQSITSGTKYLRSTWHNNVKPIEINESKSKVDVIERRGSDVNYPRINSGMDEFGEYKVKTHTRHKTNRSKSNLHKIKQRNKDFSSNNECIETVMSLINSIGGDNDEEFNGGKITSYFKKKPPQLNNPIHVDSLNTPNRLQNNNHRYEADENRHNYNSSNIVSKLDSNKKFKKLSIHNSILPYEIVPNADSNSCNPYLCSISLEEKLRDNRRSTLDNYIGRCVAVRKQDAEAKFKLGRIESINQEEGLINVIFLDLNNADSDWEETVCFRDLDVYLLEYMFSYLKDNDIHSEKKYFIATSKLDSIFDSSKFQLYQCEANPNYYYGFHVNHGFILEEIEKISSDYLAVLHEADIVDSLTTKYFKLINKNLIYFIDRSEFSEVFTNKMRSINYSSVEQHKITTLASSFKNYDLLSKHVLHEIILTMNINHKTDRRIALLLSVETGPNYESIFIKNYKTGKSQWIFLNDYKLSIRANVSKSRVLIDTLFNLKKTEENFYKILKFSYLGSSLTADSSTNYDRIVLKKFTHGINIMKEMECRICTYKIGEFDYRMCKICKQISHIGCLGSTESIKDTIHGDDYWYCKSCKPCQICLSNTNNKLFIKRTCSTCCQCYHQECLNDYIVPLYPSNPVEDKWKCENCLKCINCDVSAKEIVTKYFQNKSPSINASNNQNSPAKTNLCISMNLSSLASNKFSNNFKHCESCEKKYHQKEYCPVCRKLWQDNDVNMIECKCKYWVHEECDRIFSNDYFQKIKKKSYNCPKCRTKKKNKQIYAIVDELIKLDKFGYFYNPVDTNMIKNYTKIIKKPMCYVFILEKLEKNIYLNNMDELFSDVYLIFLNAMTYNMPNSQVHKIAEQLNINSSQFLQKYCPILYVLSFEYFLFDFYPEDTTEDNSKHILLILEELIKNNFSKQVGLLKPKTSQIIAKINEYKISWQFLKEFMENNFNCVYIRDSFKILSEKENINNEENNNLNTQTYSISVGDNILDDENSSGNKVESSNNQEVMLKPVNIEEKRITVNFDYLSGDARVNDIKMQIDHIEELYQASSEVELLKKYSVHKDKETGGENYLRENSQENETMMMIEPQYQTENSEGISIKNEAQVQTMSKSTLHRIDLSHLKNEIENGTNNLNNMKLGVFSDEYVPHEINLNTEALPNEDFKNKKRQRAKPKLIKSSEFQHELDTYNSNFELAIKSNNKIATGSNYNANHKMEISEYSFDVLNPSIALEEEEDIAIKAYEKSKLADSKLQFLYFNKYKNYIEELDNPNEFSDYLDMIMCYVNIKEDKKKKNSIDKEKIAKLKCEAYNENNSDRSDDIYEEPKRVARIKKCKQAKIELEDSSEMLISTEILNSKERKKLSAKEANIKLNTKSNENTTALDKGNSISSKKPHLNNLSKQAIHSDHSESKLKIEHSGRCKTESELFDEGINHKSILPLPTQICFPYSRVDLIFEKNCYLCGSFDDMNQFLSCSVCFENFHSYCISDSPLITSNIENIKNYNWKCQNCKFCECCEQTGNDLLLLYCDSCDRAVHTHCLDSKLYVVPESGWKCLSCFECLNCHTNKYYQSTFPINRAKDYSIFTKNFNYCFECGMKLFYKSICVKCGKSDFKNSNKDLIYVSTSADWMKYQNKLISDSDNAVDLYDDKTVIMLNCNICNNMFHSACLDIDQLGLKSYFDQFDKFNCIDCYYRQMCKDKYLEATFIKYLDVLKMSFLLMSFNKLTSSILKTICKDSNIKLHSKLLKVFLKDNFGSLIQDRKMCMLIELIRMDVFLMKDKNALFDEYYRKVKTGNESISNNYNCNNSVNILDSMTGFKTSIEIIPGQDKTKSNQIPIAMNKSFKKNKDINKKLLFIENESFYGYSMGKGKKSSLISSLRNDFEMATNCDISDSTLYNELAGHSELITEEQFLVNLEEIEKSFLAEQLRNLQLELFPTSRFLRKHNLQDLRKLLSTFNHHKLIYNIQDVNNKNVFSLGRKFLSKNVDYDTTYSLNRSMSILSRQNKKKYNHECIAENGVFSCDINHNVAMANQEDIIIDRIDNLKKRDDAHECNQSSQAHQAQLSPQEKKIINPSLGDLKNKRKRISLFQDKEIKRDLKSFFNRENRKEIEGTKINDNTNIMNFYNFNIEEYYKGTIPQSDQTNKAISFEEKEILEKTLEKLEVSLRLPNFPKHLQMFVFNTIIDANFTLRQSLLKWLLNQMLIISENPHPNPCKTSNSIYNQLMNLNLLNAALNPLFESINSNASDCTEEEISNFLDHLDPLKESPNRSTVCEFCQRKGARKFSGRLLYIKYEQWAHINCILWSKGIQVADNGNVFNVLQIVNKIKQYKCQFCRKFGATICCDSKKCCKYFHFACAHAKQSVFTDKRQFFCSKCASNAVNKEESFADFNTNKRYFIVRNQEFMNDYKTFANHSYVDSNYSSNGFRLIPKYLIGAFNKFGNTTVMKFFQINQKDMNLEFIDIAVLKYFEKPGLITKNSTEEISLLYLLNENGISFSQLSLGKENWKELEDLIERYKITNCFVKTDVDLNQLRDNSKYEILSKNFNGQYNLNLNNSTNADGNIKTERLDFFNNQIIKRLNISIDEFMTTKILSEEEKKSSKLINKKYNDWLSVMNISIPFNIILKYRTLYLRTLTEISENLTINALNSEMIPELSKNKKEIKNKLENFLNTIKTKNNIEDKQCFRFLNYMETHQQIKFVKKSLIDNELNTEASKSGDKKVNKANKQTYKNLNRTMSTNIMEMDLPLSMKFRNYKALRPRVTIGPSTIHRNGLFTTEAFQPGEIVIEYVGELITNKIADFREKEYNLKGFGDCYMFRLDAEHIIDATKYGNLARFINHCCNPNCSAQANQIGDKKHIILYAKRPIKAHEEITYDYNFECEQEKIQCRCGAINCQGRLN